MTNDELNTLRVLIREEVNAAVYASEQRMGERFDQVDKRLDRLETGQSRLEAAQKEMQFELAKTKVDISEIKSILDDVSIVINDMQGSQRALETKVEENLRSFQARQQVFETKVEESLRGLRRDFQKLTESVHSFARQFIEMHRSTNERIILHERTPIDGTHPYPHSAA